MDVPPDGDNSAAWNQEAFQFSLPQWERARVRGHSGLSKAFFTLTSTFVPARRDYGGQAFPLSFDPEALDGPSRERGL